jgi:hypothetical protein
VLLRMRCGVDWELERRAVAILVRDRRNSGLKSVAVTNAEEHPWLTDAQLAFRQQREVYTVTGFPDVNIMEGRVFRVHNPTFGRRPRLTMVE